MGVGALGVTLSGSLIAMLVCALLAGFGFGAVLTAGNLLVARLFAARSAAALNGVNVFFGVGSVLGPALAGLAGARLGLPQLGLWAGAALLLLLAPAILAFAAPPPAGQAASGPAGKPSSAAVIWLLALLLLLYVGTEVGFGGWVTVYLLNGANFSPATAALLASGFWLALTGGRVIGAALGLRMTPLTLLSAALAGLVAGAALLLLGGGAPTIAGVLLLGLSCGPVFPTTLSVVTTAAGGAGRVGLVLALGNCGGMILPALFGVLLSRYGPAAMAGTVLAASAAMLGLCAAAAAASAARSAIVAAVQPRECDAR
jgi:fucose permease